MIGWFGPPRGHVRSPYLLRVADLSRIAIAGAWASRQANPSDALHRVSEWKFRSQIKFLLEEGRRKRRAFVSYSTKADFRCQVVSKPKYKNLKAKRKPLGRCIVRRQWLEACVVLKLSTPLSWRPHFRVVRNQYFPYNGPKLAQARKSAPSRSAVPKAFQALGRKSSLSLRLCM